MSTQLQPAVAAELQDLAADLREREELINAGKRDLVTELGDLIDLGVQQGRALLLVKTKLDKRMAFPDWLAAHVPNLTLENAGKYQRLSEEQITSARTAAFAFLEPATRKHRTTVEVERSRPKALEDAWGHAYKLRRLLTPERITRAEQNELRGIKAELEPVFLLLWPETAIRRP